MSYLDDLKKKAQGVVNTVQNVGNAAYNGVKEVYNAAQNAGQNVYNAATGNTQQQAQTQPQQTQPQQTQQAQAQPATQPTTNWVDDYDAFENERAMGTAGQETTAPTTQAQGTESTAQSGMNLTQNSQWQSQLDDVMNKIMAGEKFNYDMNSDAMYQQYRDIYENQANMAMQNAMAQNAALTGGYGSSYGQMVGQQAYAQQMQGLNEIGLDLYDRAYNQYQNEQNDLYNQYNMLYGNIQDEIANGQWQQSFDEGVRQFDTTLEHESTENQLNRDFTTSEREATQGYNTSEREAIQGYNTSEREATQEYNTSEREATQDYNTSEREAGQIYNTSEREATQEFQSGENEKDRKHDIYLQDDDQEFTAGENKKDREQTANEFAGMYGDYIYDENGNITGTTGGHTLSIQNDKQEHESKENDKQLKQGDDQFGFLYGAEYDENGNLVTSENGGYYENQANDEYEKMYGEEGYYTKKDKQDQEQFDKLYGTGEYDPETGEYIKGSGGFYTEQSMTDRENEEEDWEKMYGDLQYDENGNIIGGGYQTKKDATDNQIESEQFDKLYGEDGYYTNKDKQDQEQFDKLYGEDGFYNKQSQTEYDRMYGENGYYTKKDKQDQENWQKEFDREGERYDDAQEAAKPTTKYEGEGSLNGQEVPKQLAGTPGLTTTNPGLFDDNGYFKQAAVVGENANGSMTYNIGGKEVSVKKGTSPYTNTENPDAKNGNTFDNGYQPDNVGGKKLTKLKGEEAMVNGQWVPIYTTPDGKEWVYDAANNEYFSPSAEDKQEKEENNQPTNSVASGGGVGGKYGAHYIKG